MKRYPCTPVGDEFVDEAPARFANSVVIAASPTDIWAALEDASAWPRWATPIKKVEWTSPAPFGVGTTRTVTMTGRMIVDEEFIAWEPGVRMSFRFNTASMNVVRAFAERYTLEPVSPSATEVTWTMAMAPRGISKLIVPLTGPVMRRGFGRMLRAFKRLVEDEYAGAAATSD
jgi:uncharacterized protein YndB with AHSA1/START domain